MINSTLSFDPIPLLLPYLIIEASCLVCSSYFRSLTNQNITPRKTEAINIAPPKAAPTREVRAVSKMLF